MYSNGEGLGIRSIEEIQKAAWQSADNAKLFKKGKCFVHCICPRCTVRHRIYMLWTGRGVPRKYCGNCKPLISGYDETAVHEAAVSFPGHARKRGRRIEGE